MREKLFTILAEVVDIDCMLWLKLTSRPGFDPTTALLSLELGVDENGFHQAAKAVGVVTEYWRRILTRELASCR